jgi:hypothetical protein
VRGKRVGGGERNSLEREGGEESGRKTWEEEEKELGGPQWML